MKRAMPAALDPSVDVENTPAPVAEQATARLVDAYSVPGLTRDPKTGHWLKGYCPNPAGRPLGSTNRKSEHIYLNALPRKARQWVKSTAPAVLIDARKIALPIDSDAPASASVQSTLIAFFERQLLPRSVAADDSASMIPAHHCVISDDQPIRSVGGEGDRTPVIRPS